VVGTLLLYGAFVLIPFVVIAFGDCDIVRSVSLLAICVVSLNLNPGTGNRTTFVRGSSSLRFCCVTCATPCVCYNQF
jgi:hypothetical protein